MAGENKLENLLVKIRLEIPLEIVGILFGLMSISQENEGSSANWDIIKINQYNQGNRITII